MTGFFIGGGLVLAVLAALAAGLVLLLRQRSYRRRFQYDPRQNCIAPFTAGCIESAGLQCTRKGFVMPDLQPGAASGLLELDVRASLAGMLFDPSVEITAPGYCDSQYLERGVRGVRFLNVSRLLASGVAPGELVTLRGRRLVLRAETARLHAWRERLHPGERVLVIAPHPDDAEIAAFGLYADTGAAIVTITAGDGTDRFRAGATSINVPCATVARMRVWDSITVPQFGGVGLEQAVNLCYPDGKLQSMQANPDCEFRGKWGETINFLELRSMNRSPLVRAGAKCTWNSLVCDLVQILETVKPTVIVTSHPWLDPHADHMCATAAVCEALRTAGPGEGRFFFYANHNRRTELWPFGPMGSGVPLLPLLADDVVDCDGFYSHPLSPERQSQKFLALEAMHDLRDVGMPEPRPLRVHVSRIRSEVSAALHGMGSPPTGYVRRAVRPDELYFTSSFVKGRALCARIPASS